MTNIQPNNQITKYSAGTPLYTVVPNNVSGQQSVSVVPNNYTAPIYQYPQTSVYNDPTKQAASGVNIYIYNPSGMSGPSSTANTTYSTPVVQSPVPQQQVLQTQDVSPYLLDKNLKPLPAVPLASTPVSEPEIPSGQKTKRVTILTDDYIKSLESYLHSPDKTIRKSGIREIVQRYEEDNTRYEDPALTALLNIALQDPDANNRMLAMSAVAGGSAHGDSQTLELLQNLTNSSKLYGQEAQMASSALICAAKDTKLVPDYSPDKPKSNKR